MFIPFIIFPYLIRVLGTETYGLVIYAQTIISYLSILISFGFNLSGVKIVSEFRNDGEKLSEIISSIFIIKFILFLISLIILTSTLIFLPLAGSNKMLFILSMTGVLNELLFPTWYFQGIEEMSYWTNITVLCRLIYLGLILLLVQNPDDYLYVPSALGISHTIGGAIAIYIIFFKHNIKFRFQSFITLLTYSKDSLPLFLSGLSVNIISINNKLIIGSFLGMEEVAFYDIADKIRKLFKLPQTIFSQAIYPKVSREKSIVFIKKMFKVMFSIDIILICFVLLTSKYIILILGSNQMLPSLGLVNVLIFSILFLGMKDVFGVHVLISNSQNKIFTKAILISLFTYLIQIILIWITIGFSSLNIIISYLTSEIFGVLCMFYYCKKLKLWT
tara:strand:- start:629 stop:1795 length:1167 start_codon:yes stop_codon:yes gene_type:complete